MTRLVIFDMDGTLIDSQAHIVTAMTAAFEAVDLDCPARTDLLSVVGLSFPYAFEVLAPDLSAHSYEVMQKAYRACAYARVEAFEAAPLYEGAEPALERLVARGDVQLAVATGASLRGMSEALTANGISDKFSSQQCADDHPSKPNPSMVQTCLIECDTVKERTVVVGDTTYDMEMAQAAQCASIGVAWGNHGKEALLSAGAHCVIETFEQLDAALDAIWKE